MDAFSRPPDFKTDFKRFYKLATLGFHSGPPYMKKYLYCQIIVGSFFFVFYLYFNGGLIPWFWKIPPQPEVAPDVFVLDLFLKAQQDGLKVSWLHGVNSREALELAMKSEAMMLEADIILRGQGTQDQQMVPIVASPPAVTSDLTFEEWINIVKEGQKGFELHFHSIEAVELTLQTLEGLPKQLQIPVWLQANILRGPNAVDEPLDLMRFLRLTTTHYPKSTLSLGWCTSVGQQHENHYNWTAVKAMYDLIENRNIMQPLTFHVRAALAWRSIAQLRWLMEMTGATVTLHASTDDGVTLKNLQYIRNRLPKDEVFYDIPEELQSILEGMRDEKTGASEESHALMGERDKGLIFKAEEWIILRADHGEKVYMGTESLVLQRGILLSRNKFDVASKGMLSVHGRVEFVEHPVHTNSPGTSGNDLGLEVILSVVQGGRPGAISGFKCFIGAQGHIAISTQGIPGTDAREDSSMFDIAQNVGCVHFTIEYKDLKKVNMTVTQVQDCSHYESKVLKTSSVTLPIMGIVMDPGHVALRGTGDDGFAALPMLKVFH